MKKGFLALFGAIALACAGASFAAAPVIKPIPDVHIGDMDLPEASATDANFFVYTNAFKFDDYVTDADTPVANLLWSFDEGDEAGGGIALGNVYTINGKSAVHLGTTAMAADGTANAAHVAPGAANELRSVSQYATFRNVVLSPTSQNWPFPSPSTALATKMAAGKVIRLFAADPQGNVASKDIFVKSIDNTMDSLSATTPFSVVKDDPFDSSNISANGWTAFGATNIASNSTLDWASGAYRIRTLSLATGKWHNAGFSNNRPDWIGYDSINSDNFVRAKFYVYAQSDGSAGWSVNDIPSFGMRLTYRFAFWTQLFVNPHEATAMPSASDLRPSVDSSKPSIYRVDFDPVDVPYLATYTNASGQKEGIGAAFEVFETSTGPRGYLAMTELVTGIYPASTLSGTPTQSKIYDGTKDAQGGDLHRFVSTDSTIANLVPATGTGLVGDEATSVEYTASELITYSESAQGVSLSSSAVPTAKYGSGEVTFHAGVNGVASNATRVRIKEGEVYKARFHMLSTQATSSQACIWLNAKTVGTAYIAYLEMQGGSTASGGAALRQVLPGVGNANRDKNVADTTGGWYTVIMNSPLNKDIATDRTGTTIDQLMPNLAAQPGPGVDASSRRDVKVGARLWDSLSSTVGANAAEVGQITIDRIEVTAYPQIQD